MYFWKTDVGSSFIVSFQICFAHNLFYVLKIELRKCFLSTFPAEDFGICRFDSCYFPLSEHDEFFFSGSLG